MYESTDKMVSHPDHYQSENGMEVIDVIAAFTAGLTGVEAYDAGNIIKYACRWSKKNGIQDLEKIIWYATHLIEHLKKKQEQTKKEFDDSYEYEGVEESYGTIDDEECLKANYTRKEVYDIFVELVKEGKILSTEILDEIYSYRDCIAPDGEIIPDTIEIIGFSEEELMFTFSVNDRDHYILSDKDQNTIVDTLLEDLK